MLHIITPQERHIYANTLTEMFKHLNSVSSKHAHQKDEFDNDETVYCVYIDDRFGHIGSARLCPHPSLLADQIHIEQVESGYWECNRVFFDIHEDQAIHQDPEAFMVVTQQFYQELYKGIKEFGETYGIKALVCVNDYEEHEDIVFFGQWPFEVESLIDIESEESVSTYTVGGCSFVQD